MNTIPRPTPELASALANQYIEELHIADERSPVERAFEKIVGPYHPGNAIEAGLAAAAVALAGALNYPRPYETVVTLSDGHQLPPERHTITYFTDGEPGFTGHGFQHHDWAAVSVLDVGESYIVQGAAAAMTVTRKE